MHRHELDAVALVAGLLTVAAAVLYLLDTGGVLDVTLGWIAPVVFIAVGAAGLATALRSRDGETDGAEP